MGLRVYLISFSINFSPLWGLGVIFVKLQRSVMSIENIYLSSQVSSVGAKHY